MSETTSTKPAPPVRVECVIPILSVRDLATSLAFYLDVLGFRTDWKGERQASVSRDGKSIMLVQGEQGPPGTWVWIGVDDVEPLYAEWRARGVQIVLEPTNFWWALEFRVRDPDGHVLRFGSDAKTDRPTVN